MTDTVRRLALGALLFFSSVSISLAADGRRFTTICDCVYTNAPCEGKFRWAVKTDTTTPPKSGIKKVTPTTISHWPDLAPDPQTKTYQHDAPRFPAETKWYELTGRLTRIRADSDGDLHIQLQDANGTNHSVNVIVEVPDGSPWCGVRSNAFSLTQEQPPLDAPDELTLLRTNAVIRVVGRPFYDGQHAVTGHKPNRRMGADKDRNVAIWEIHPVMDLQIVK